MEVVPKLTARRDQRLKSEERSVSDALLRAEIARRRWYHQIDVGHGIVTPGFPWQDIWNNTRQVRHNIDYDGKTVLDLGSWDGLWAFEAEALGAAVVVATDCINTWQVPWHQGMANLFLVREALYSEVIPFWNVPPTALRDGLAAILHSHQRLQNGFDIIQHLGLLYHLRDPMLSLAQARSVVREGGTLLLETAVLPDEERCALYFNADGKALYDDFTTWWVPTLPCLREMLRVSLFDLKEQKVMRPCSPAGVCRAAFRAVALPPGKTFVDRYNLDPACNHGFGEHLITEVPFEDPTSPSALEAYFQARYKPAKDGT